jgi:hypothetical protein
MTNLAKKISVFIIIISVVNNIFGQTLTVSGRLFDKDDGRIISNGTIFLDPGRRTTVTNPKGEYSFSCPAGKKQISARVLGYKAATIEFMAGPDTIINIYLQVSPFELNEVNVIGDQVKNVRVTSQGNFVVTPAALYEAPRLFSEPDLLKSFQFMPGVVSGKEGSSDIYVRGGGAGQNVILANGCYFFLPGHFLGMISPIDLDFLESAELYKDYFPAELGGGAGSVISLQFKKPQSDSLRAQLRLGFLSSGFTIELPFKKKNLNITAGLKRGNYAIYAPVLKKILSEDISDYLPSDKYSFYDGFLKVTQSSEKYGKIDYLFFGNYDNGKDEKKTVSINADTLMFYTDRISTGWKNMVHALEWEPPVKNALRWKFNLNYNRLSIGREAFNQTDKRLFGTLRMLDLSETTYSFSPTINTIGSSLEVSGDKENINWSAGVSDRIRYFSPNITAESVSFDHTIKHSFGETTKIFEPSAFFSSTWHLSEKLVLDAGVRISGGFAKGAAFVVPEPRIRLSFNPEGTVSPHLNYVRLSQFDHSLEGSNTGLRTMLWLPVSKDFGPEISNVVSAGFQGQINNQFIWNLDGYYKKITGMVDFQSGASFVYDTSFVDLIERIGGRAYGLETGIIKRTGNLTGSLSYTYSRSKQEYIIPEGLIWIPSSADRPHNFNLALKYHLSTRTSFGINWVYQSGAPATIYEQETSYGEFFDSKNNIRYFDYHRMDLSIRQTISKRKFSVFIDADIYNVYNRKNTFFFKKSYDGFKKLYYYKNVTLFPIMPSLTVTIKY